MFGQVIMDIKPKYCDGLCLSIQIYGWKVFIKKAMDRDMSMSEILSQDYGNMYITFSQNIGPHWILLVTFI